MVFQPQSGNLRLLYRYLLAFLPFLTDRAQFVLGEHVGHGVEGVAGLRAESSEDEVRRCQCQVNLVLPSTFISDAAGFEYLGGACRSRHPLDE